MVLDRSCALQQAKSFCNTICQKATFTLQQNFLFDRRAERSGAGESFTRAARLEPHVRKNAASPVQFVAGKTHVRMKRSVVSVPAVDAERGGAIMLKRTHCAPCAAPSQAAVAQGSGDLMPHRAFTAHRGALLCATALAGTMVFAALAAMPALADGGAGGSAGGGAGGTGGPRQPPQRVAMAEPRAVLAVGAAAAPARAAATAPTAPAAAAAAPAAAAAAAAVHTARSSRARALIRLR